MEPAVRGARVETAIVTARLERRFSSQNRRSFGLPSDIGRRNPAAGNGIFGCRDRRPKSGLESTSFTRDRRSGTIPAEIPTQTARFWAARKTAVWLDWMVVCAVIYEPVSLILAQYQGDFRKKQRAGGRKFQKRLQHGHFSNIAPIRHQGGTGSAQ
jgi:hypothetical protein